MKLLQGIGALALATIAIASPPSNHPQGASGEAESLRAFTQMLTVMTSPRCQNCHTLTQYPRQGDDRHTHMFNVQRGPDNHGSPGQQCSVCHGQANNPVSGVPGANEIWRLAPLSMGWEGLPAGEICRHLKDPARNGNRTGAQVIDHLKTNLVMWAWTPGTDPHGKARTLPPMAYAAFLEAAQAWVRSGEICPP